MPFLAFPDTKFLPSNLGTAESWNGHPPRSTKWRIQKVMISQLCITLQFPTTVGVPTWPPLPYASYLPGQVRCYLGLYIVCHGIKIGYQRTYLKQNGKRDGLNMYLPDIFTLNTVFPWTRVDFFQGWGRVRLSNQWGYNGRSSIAARMLWFVATCSEMHAKEFFDKSLCLIKF